MEKHVGYVCTYCGSSAILMDAWTVWDTEQQDWVLHDTLTEAYCRECDGETSLIEVDNQIFESPTHKVDCFKGRVALELEWNNKDPFFDRDLNNFRLLFDLRAIDVGVIVTRATELQTIFKQLGKGSSYGASTTHHSQLWPRIEGGGGGGCPVLTFAITPALYVDDGLPTAEQIAEALAEPDED